MDNHYKSKYLLYKQKYQELKQLINEQTGGVICSDCGKSVSSYDELIMHKRQVHNVGLTPTEHRRKQNAEAAKKRRDLIRSGIGGIKCNYCDMTFYDSGYLAIHLIRNHKSIINLDDLIFVKSYIRTTANVHLLSIKELESKLSTANTRQGTECDSRLANTLDNIKMHLEFPQLDESVSIIQRKQPVEWNYSLQDEIDFFTNSNPPQPMELASLFPDNVEQNQNKDLNYLKLMEELEDEVYHLNNPIL